MGEDGVGVGIVCNLVACETVVLQLFSISWTDITLLTLVQALRVVADLYTPQ